MQKFPKNKIVDANSLHTFKNRLDKFMEEKYVQGFTMTLSSFINKLLSHQSPETEKVVRKILLFVLPVPVCSPKPPCTATTRCCV